MKKIFFVSLCLFTIAISTTLTACISDNVDDSNQITIENKFQEQYLSFEEIVQCSDVAIVGEYVETIEYDYYIEQKFKVKNVIYGSVADSEIYLYSNRGSSYVEEIDYTYKCGADVYTVGKEYILVMNKLESVFYDHDRYMTVGNLFLSEGSSEYSVYSEPIDIPNGMTLKDYLCSIYNSVSRPIVSTEIISYVNDLDEMIGESKYIGTVKILELVNEGKVHNGNVYRCVVESLSKGSDLNTYEDGTILLVIMKNTVTVNDSYIIGFTSSSDTSLIYTQTTDSSVYEVSNELLAEISQELAE